jgi:hypothetical protein
MMHQDEAIRLENSLLFMLGAAAGKEGASGSENFSTRTADVQRKYRLECDRNDRAW